MSSSASLNRIKSENVGKTYYVRYMLSLRCKKIVREELEKLETKHRILPYSAIEFPDGIDQKKVNTLKKNLRRSGMDLLNLYESMLVEKFISTITEVIHEFDHLPNLTYTEIISKNLNEASESVMKIFTEVVGMSVVQFIVTQKIDRVKENLLYDDLSLSEISKKLNYSSEQHLIAQFQKDTGLTPDHFQKIKEKRSEIISQNKSKSMNKKKTKSKRVG